MSETLSEYLTKSTVGISPEQFRHGRVQLGGHASWAIWGENTYDLDCFEEANEPWTKVRNNVFLLGGNTGLFRDGRLTTFSNFHTEGHRGDAKLRNAIAGTLLEGAYLSDIVKDYPTTDSGSLIARMKAEIARNESFLNEKVFEPLVQERKLLGSPAGLVLVLLGKGPVTCGTTCPRIDQPRRDSLTGSA